MFITTNDHTQSTFWLDLTHQLLGKFTIKEFLTCLNQKLALHPSRCRIALLIHHGERYHWHIEDPHYRCNNNSDLFENGPLRQVETTHQPLHLNYQEFAKRYPALFAEANYPDFGYYLALPIVDNQGHYNLCEVFSEEPFTDIESLSYALSIAFAHLQSHVQLSYQEAQLCQQRDDFHVLVNVTNSILAQRDLDQMIVQIASEIHRYFAINALSITLPTSQNNQRIDYNTFFYDGEQLQEQEQLHRGGVEENIEQVFKQAKTLFCFLDKNTDSSLFHQKIIKYWPNENHELVLIPIVYADHVLGVMQVAPNCQYPLTEPRLRLLTQIAERVGIAIDNARSYHEIKHLKEQLVHENDYLTQQIDQLDHQFDQVIGRSPAISNVMRQIEIVAKTDCSVLLLGETGTGKELFAKAIHQMSPRSQKRMIKMNCAAMPAGLLESDLFGHEKGAFTGANNCRAGRFELAHQSSLFLDEIGDMPLELQPKLLRVLQEQEFERLGGNKLINVDVRLIAATNCDLKQMVEDKEFRSDLFYRLNVFPVRLPPLRERLEDLPSLVKFFVFKSARHLGREINSIPAKVITQLQQHPWPGNVRELENVVERAVLLSPGHELCLPPEISLLTHSMTPSPSIATPAHQTVPDDQYQQIIEALQASNGVIAGPRGAAQRLGIKRTTLLSRMKRMGIDKNQVLSYNI